MPLFDLPPNLPRPSQVLLEYITTSSRCTGICSWLIWRNDDSYKFLKDEICKISDENEEYPIERALWELYSDKFFSVKSCYNYQDFNDQTSPAMQLRFWWAYNLAVVYARQVSST